jgi:TATA-box binding protein (TBP) (component of TFIID and TFIIIB)
LVEVKIVNVVATADLKQYVDIQAVGKLKGFLHDSEIYGGRVAYFQSSDLKGKVTIFPSGKLISVGANNIAQAFDNFRIVTEVLVEYQFIKSTLYDKKVRNIVAVTDFNQQLDLEWATIHLSAIYEPEQFPAAIVKFEDPKSTILLFSSGKAVITGLHDPSLLNDVIKKLSKKIQLL